MAPTIWPALSCNFYAADACANDQMAQIGGFIWLSERTVWFSERFTPEYFYQVDLEVNHNMQRDFVCCETLAQLDACMLCVKNFGVFLLHVFFTPRAVRH